MREFIVSLEGVNSFDEFVAAFNSGFCNAVGGHWNGRSWDAFNDYLSWPEENEYRLSFEGWHKCPSLSAEDRRMITEIVRGNPHVAAKYA
ncbi:barstar family protein [Noviherbaspirillum massiliense]|uniref:barstar family protein n=1 Tax=Noviherbaspirillum massiliense TaxID=1465823 RepID=UPI0011DC9894|nr:hypothetical protein [Noviherbaspirillum massiliense]